MTKQLGGTCGFNRIGLICLVLAASTLKAREIHVNNQTGNDQNSGTSDAPLQSARRAVSTAQAGDVIHLFPEGAVYREMVTFNDNRDITIEGHDCIVTGADPLPKDPAQWETVSKGLHRIRLKRTLQDRHILVVDGQGVTMGRTKYMIGRSPLPKQYPEPADLQDGQFAWESIDDRQGWLYVKGPLNKLEWAVRPQGIYTTGEVRNITIRDLHVRHALNDGFNIHGNTQGMRLINVTGNECFDNGISPHGACSLTVEDSEFLRNEMAVGNDFLTETHFLRCTIGESVQEEVMIIGGQHLFQDCRIRATGSVAIRLAVSKPGGSRPLALKEIAASGKNPEMKPRYTFRSCTLESAAETPCKFIVGPQVNLIIENCTFSRIQFEIDANATVKNVDSSLDGETLTVDR